ncbi:hypothetical protein PoB_007349600 [Plakobranchus ocellatus]|uniref:Uncharacterized protein n=1 Tax=Plakobranchus ocellatus TaxID=259542 RepID=A0AAV4DSX7_9GAST|nr:hypothetical protein PoB_007349600 [Plakobranchus ocellatus]
MITLMLSGFMENWWYPLTRVVLQYKIFLAIYYNKKKEPGKGGSTLVTRITADSGGQASTQQDESTKTETPVFVSAYSAKWLRKSHRSR